jgi:hypothetical protein
MTGRDLIPKSGPGSERYWRDSIKATNEDAVISWVIRALEQEGFTVVDLGRPERDQTLRPENRRRPDRWVTVNGLETAIEHTTFALPLERTERAQAMEVARRTRAALTVGRRSALVTFGYDPAALNRAGKGGRDQDALVLADAVTRTLADPRAFNDRHLVRDGLPGWVRDVAVGASATPTGRGHVNVVPVARRDDEAARVDAFIRDRIAKKGTQHVGWGRGVLVIAHGESEHAEDVAAGFARIDGSHPWWRVYWTDQTGAAYLVARAD